MFTFGGLRILRQANHDVWLVYALSVFHGFILMSLYNLQEHIEDPFDQMGLDDIKLVEFQFREETAPVATAASPAPQS